MSSYPPCPRCGARWAPVIEPTNKQPTALYCQRCGQKIKDLPQPKEMTMIEDREPPMHYDPAMLVCLACDKVGPWALGQQDTYILMNYGGLDYPTTYREEDGSRTPFVLCDECYEQAEKAFLETGI